MKSTAGAPAIRPRPRDLWRNRALLRMIDREEVRPAPSIGKDTQVGAVRRIFLDRGVAVIGHVKIVGVIEDDPVGRSQAAATEDTQVGPIGCVMPDFVTPVNRDVEIAGGVERHSIRSHESFTDNEDRLAGRT